MVAKFEKVEYTADDIGCMLFESITRGLYSKPLHAIREYVQNEIEADPPPQKIEVLLEGRNLSIIGDGGGMNPDDVSRAKKVGLSFKDPTKHFGFRGIGIWSGVSIADKIIVSTKKQGMEEWLILEIDCKGIREELEKRTVKPLTQMLSEHVVLGKQDGPQDAHGTHVQLVGLLDEVSEYFTETSVKHYMGQVLPVDFDSRFDHAKEISKNLRRNVFNYATHNIFFNGQPINRPPYIRSLEKPMFGLISESGKELGYFWICLNKEREKISDEDCRGVVYKQWNYTVGDRKSCRPFLEATLHLADWYVGEVHVISKDIIADSTRMLFECSPAFDALEAKLKDEMKNRVEDARKKSHVETLEEKIAEAKEIVKTPKQFGDNREKLKSLARVESTKDYLTKKQQHKWTPTSQKQNIKKMTTELEDVAQKILEIPVAQTTLTKAQKATTPKKTPENIQSFDQLTDLFGITGMTEEVLKVVEEVLNRTLSKDAQTLKQVKSEILSALAKKLQLR